MKVKLKQNMVYSDQFVFNFFQDPHLEWEGSDDWIRLQFADYLESFLSSVVSIQEILNINL